MRRRSGGKLAPPRCFTTSCLHVRHERPLFSFKGKRVSFYKRAQILVADSWGIMEARGEADLVNMEWLTMFADYRIPQALVHLGVLRYSDALMQALKNGENTSFFFFPAGKLNRKRPQAVRCFPLLPHLPPTRRAAQLR